MPPTDHASPSPFAAISAIDYTVIFTRDMEAMRAFYETVMGFSHLRSLSPNWHEYRIGPNTLALAKPGLTPDDAPLPHGSAALQLAFRVPTATVDACAEMLDTQGIPVLSPPADRNFGSFTHRTLFFRDPDGNVLEIYAEFATP
ncbi:VOC family protein [Rhodobacteraceae bacterium D3-12]|nr:VOC family protein [Rhodobacteraceae bacterium D3-12]